MDGKKVIQIDMLQWSRSLSAAEIRTDFRRSEHCFFCFNGAAAFQPRKFEDCDIKFSHRSSASMEPQPFSRGNHSDRSDQKSTCWLQWSRSLSAAEMVLDACQRHAGIPLQWSRSLSAAEIPGHVVP